MTPKTQYRVALLGNPGSGKTAISYELGHVVSFAGALKIELARVLADATGIPPLELYDEMNEPETKDAYRTLLQGWGEWRRARDTGYWVRQAEKRLDRLSGVDVVAVDDCRLPNEYDMLRSRGFIFIHLQDGPHVRTLTTEQLAHESERYWRDFKVHARLDYEEGVKHQAQRVLDIVKELHG